MPKKLSALSSRKLASQLSAGDDFYVIDGDGSHKISASELGFAILGVYNLRWFGAKGDGLTDDTAAIQAWLDAAPNGAELFAPAGKYVFSSVTTGNKTLTIEGVGWRASVGAAFGSASLLSKGLYSGTVFFSTATTGAAFDLNPLSSWAINLRDLAVIGPGSGTSQGIRVRSSTPGNSLVRCGWSNVLVANFYDGIEFAAVLGSWNVGLTLVGTANKALSVIAYNNVGSNSNSFLQTKTYFSGEYGIYVYDCGGNYFQSTLLENMPAGKIGAYFGESTPNNNNDNAMDMVWAEHGTAGQLVDSIYFDGGRNNLVEKFHGGTWARVTFNKGYGHKLIGSARFTAPGPVFVINSGAVRSTYDSRDIDLDGDGAILDSGTGSIDKAA